MIKHDPRWATFKFVHTHTNELANRSETSNRAYAGQQFKMLVNGVRSRLQIEIRKASTTSIFLPVLLEKDGVLNYYGASISGRPAGILNMVFGG